MAATTPVPDLLDGLERLRLPKGVRQIAAFMIRYTDVIRRAAPHAGRPGVAGLRPAVALAGAAAAATAGTLFIRSYERGERVYLAMVVAGLRRHDADARGPTRRPRRNGSWRWRCRPSAAIVVAVAWAGDAVSDRRRSRSRGVAFAYPDGHRRLFGVDLTIDAGERVALLGPNGAGKTTLVLHLNGILSGGAGEVRVGGLPVDQGEPRARSASASASSSRTPTTSCSCRRCATTSPSARPTSG